ncbi:hypothetical protein FRC03_006086 [Tulasnella sp. 419]|nr:hypothetical protein FRC03_006086 [Tulasnella sp. 419]
MPPTLFKQIQTQVRLSLLLRRGVRKKEDDSIVCPPTTTVPQAASPLSPSAIESTCRSDSRVEEHDVLAIERFWGMPTEIKVIILECLQGNLKQLALLCRANKFFNELVTPILYANVDLRCSRPHRPCCRSGVLPGNDTLKRQIAYLTTVRKRPDYLAKARHLKWEFIASGWTVFPRMTNIQSIEITMDGETIGPETIVPVFPNLRRAVLAGCFYTGSLECILLSSPLLTELHLVDAVGETGDSKLGRSPTLIPFLDLCSSTPGKMPNLKILTLSRNMVEYTRDTLEEPEPALKSWAGFLRQYAYQLEVLKLELERENYYTMMNAYGARKAFEEHILPLLKSGEFKRLNLIDIARTTTLSHEDATQIEEALPPGVNFMWTQVSPESSASFCGNSYIFPQEFEPPFIYSRGVCGFLTPLSSPPGSSFS